MTKFENSWGIHMGEGWLETTHMEAAGRSLHVGCYPFHYLLCNRTHPYPIAFNRLRLFSSQPSPMWIPQLFSNLVIIHLLAYEDGTDRVFRNVSI